MSLAETAVPSAAVAAVAEPFFVNISSLLSIIVADATTGSDFFVGRDLLQYPQCMLQSTTPAGGDRIKEFMVTINGFVIPCLVALTLVTNVLVCVVLLRDKMRTPTNVVLVAMAVSDILTGVSPLPCFIYLYTLDAYRDHLSYAWCRVYYWLTDFLPTIFHTASVWLIVTLAIERYIYVCHALVAKNVCTVRNILRVIVVIYFTATAVHATRFFDHRVQPVTVESLAAGSNTTIDTCCIEYIQPFADHLELYFGIYFWFRVVFVEALPSAALCLLNARLVIAMRRTESRRSRLIRQHRLTESGRLRDANATTLMLLVVVGLFLVVELPTGVSMALLVVENSTGRELTDIKVRNVLELITNLVIVLSYPVNFFVYCTMSRHFRRTFRAMFCSRYGRPSPNCSSSAAGRSGVAVAEAGVDENGLQALTIIGLSAVETAADNTPKLPDTTGEEVALLQITKCPEDSIDPSDFSTVDVNAMKFA